MAFPFVARPVSLREAQRTAHKARDDDSHTEAVDGPIQRFEVPMAHDVRQREHTGKKERENKKKREREQKQKQREREMQKR